MSTETVDRNPSGKSPNETPSKMIMVGLPDEKQIALKDLLIAAWITLLVARSKTDNPIVQRQELLALCPVDGKPNDPDSLRSRATSTNDLARRSLLRAGFTIKTVKKANRWSKDGEDNGSYRFLKLEPEQPGTPAEKNGAGTDPANPSGLYDNVPEFLLQGSTRRVGRDKAKLSPEERAEEKKQAIRGLRRLLQLNLSRAIIVQLADEKLRFDQDIKSYLRDAMPSDMPLEEITGAISSEELSNFFEISIRDTLERWWNMEADIESIPLREKAAVAACRKLKTESTIAPLSMQDVLNRISKRFDSSPRLFTSSPPPQSPKP